MTRLRLAAFGVLSMVSSGCTGSTGVEPLPAAGTMAGKPPVVLITLDTLRYDHVSTYGYHRQTTPVIDALGKDGLVFERAVATAAATTPSHASILTGLYPHQHGVVSNTQVAKRPYQSGPARRSVTEMLAEDGYATGAFVSGGTVKRRTGLSAGFDTYDEPTSSSRACPETIDNALSWLKHQQQPYFLWIHLWDPHAPNNPDAEQLAAFADDPRSVALSVERKVRPEALKGANKRQSFRRFFATDNRRVKPIDTHDVGKLIDRYDADIAVADACVGRVIDALRERGDYERAVTIVTNDHGQSLGQEDHLGHNRLTVPNIRAPLVVRFPDGIIAPQRLGGTVSHVDLMPTVLARFTDLSGHSEMAMQAAGTDVLSGTFKRNWAFSFRSTHPENPPRQGIWTLTTPRWLLRHSAPMGGLNQLFDLDNDPLTLTNVAHENPKVLRRLLRTAEKLKADRPHALDVRAMGTGGEAAMRAELRSLGYVDGD